MSWRTVIINSRCKLDYKLGFMVVRAEETKRVYLDEIAVLLIENPAVSLTGCLLEALIEKKIKVIFCDSKRNPNAELVPYYGCYDCSKKIKTQIAWTYEMKGYVWVEVIKTKISKQKEFLIELRKYKEAELLQNYLEGINFYDESNREGHAAKVYFNAVFGMDFTRSATNQINAALNYGYSILLSAFNREIVASGYLTQIGLFHDNVFNYFNFACDLMEPYRILVDRKVYSFGKDFIFDSEKKRALTNLLNDTVKINNTRQTVLNAIRIYTRSIFEALNNGDVSCILGYSDEL
ncbi:MAG: type II CRISPR-associated endonuclease Cas1 [Clostridia bacterium]|nr:type II CRISPR-associated endonuclease Cas1 [Clostridia bacterium]